MNAEAFNEEAAAAAVGAALLSRLLVRWGLRAASGAPRSAAERVQGVLQLMRRQVYCFSVQIALLVAGLILIAANGT